MAESDSNGYLAVTWTGEDKQTDGTDMFKHGRLTRKTKAYPRRPGGSSSMDGVSWAAHSKSRPGPSPLNRPYRCADKDRYNMMKIKL